MPIQEEATRLLSTMFKDMGMDELSTKIIAVVYFSPGEVTMEEIAKKTGYSLASISTKLKNMQLFIEKRKKPGSKKIYYYMEKDLVKINMRKAQVAQEKMTAMKSGLGMLIEKYKSKKLSPEEKEKFDIVENYYNQMNIMDKFLEEFREYLKEKQGEAKT